MFSQPTHLTIRSTSPTTVSFTVSNASIKSTLSSRILFWGGIAARILIGTVVLLLVFSKAQNIAISQYNSTLWQGFETGLIGSFFYHIAAAIELKFLAIGSFALLYLISRRGYTEESLLVLRGLGIQTSTSSPTYFSSATTRFIPTTQIQDIVIHEAFKGFEVRFYLAVIVDGETEVVVVFPTLLPRRRILEEVWRGAKRCLYDVKS